MKNMSLLLPVQAAHDTHMWATVTQASPLRIRVDGETTALPFTPDTLVTGLALDDRVWIGFANNDDLAFLGKRVVVMGRAGGIITVPAHTHPAFPLGELGFAERTSDSGTTTSTTEKPILSLEDIAIGAGRSIRVYTNTILIASDTNNDSFTMRLRYTTDGSTPTIASPEFEDAVWQTIDSQGAGSAVITRVYHPASAQTLSLLLTLQRRTGAGVLKTVGITQITVQDIGVAVADTGTDL